MFNFLGFGYYLVIVSCFLVISFMINKSIFKSYDVRGIYPAELNERAAFAIGRAFIKKTKAQNVVVGHDARLSSPALFGALVQGLLAEGAKVTSIGQTPTEGLYFAATQYGFDAGLMLTASHNPKEYNGVKMVKKDGDSIRVIPGKDLLSFVEEDAYVQKNVDVDQKDIWLDYVNFVMQFSGDIKPFSIIIDASNGVGGKSIEYIKDKLPVAITELNFEPDGDFPNHSPNPMAAGATDQIKVEILKQKADFGIMFDGDADRLFLVDECGELVKADVVLLLLAKHFLAKYLGAAIAYNNICSRAVPEFIKKWGGVPLRTKVGFVNVQEGIIHNKGIMGGELSGHYCFKDYFYMDSGIVVFLILLQVISQDGRKVSEMVKELSPYAKSFEVSFKTENPGTILEKIKQAYADGKQDFLDGITVEYEDWWFNLRLSNTEPVIKLTIEASAQDLLEQKKKQLVAIIEQ